MCKFKVLFRYKLTTNIKFKKKTWFVLLLILLGKNKCFEICIYKTLTNKLLLIAIEFSCV